MRLLALVIVLAAVGGCSSSDPANPGADAAGPPDANLRPDSAPGEFAKVYGHSGQDLYGIETTNLELTQIGPFDTGGPSITDIAIDKNDVMIGVSLAAIWSIDPATGAATEIAAFDGGSENLTSLSFVPLDADDPQSAERLIAAGDMGNVYEVDPTTGVTTLLGNYGLADGVQIRSSGDIVSVRGAGTFATVTIGDTLLDPDFLATIDTTTWLATPIGDASTGYDRIFGLGYWRGAIFGFVDDGAEAGTGTMITIDPVDGTAAPAKASAFRWFGAGVSTDAPIVE